MHKVLVILAADRDSANVFCNSIGAQGETFTVALDNADNVLAGYWCGWNMTDEQFAEISANGMFQVFDTAQEALTFLGWHIPLAEEVVSD